MKQYSAYFVDANDRQNLLGTQFPKIDEAARLAIKSHEAAYKELPWLVAVGWDCMLTDEDEWVFFEGNFAGARTPRLFFLNY